MEQDKDTLAEACAEVMWASDTASQALGMKIDRVAAGVAILSMDVRSDMCNGHGTCHGGFMFTLADSAFAFACNGYNQRAVAQHCSITYISPPVEGDRLTATAREVSRQGRSGIFDVRVTKQDGTVVAEFRGHSRTIRGTLLATEEEGKT